LSSVSLGKKGEKGWQKVKFAVLSAWYQKKKSSKERGGRGGFFKALALLLDQSWKRGEKKRGGEKGKGSKNA